MNASAGHLKRPEAGGTAAKRVAGLTRRRMDFYVHPPSPVPAVPGSSGKGGTVQ